MADRAFFYEARRVEARVGLITEPGSRHALRAPLRRWAAMRDYFYGLLIERDIDVVDILREEGFFNDPPGLVEGDGGAAFGHPRCPEAEYLAHVAARNPQAVLRAIDAMPDTGNIRCHEELLRAANAMDVTFGARLGTAIQAWSLPAMSYSFQQQMEEYVTRMATTPAGRDVAFATARALFEIVPDSTPRQGRTMRGVVFSHPGTRLPTSEYREVSQRLLPALERVDGPRAVQLVVSLLARFLELSYRSGPPTDYSTIWQEQVGRDTDYTVDSLSGDLVASVRGSVARVLRADPAKLEDVVGILTAHQWYVCHRLALHAARQNIGERLHPTVVRMLLNRDYLAGYTVEREYMELAEVAYPLLSGKQRDSWVALVARGPRRKGEGPWSDELRAQWTGQRMAPFADTLTSEQREAVRRWWPPHTEASVRAPRYQDEEKVWVGPTSPVAEAAMGEMSVPDVAAYLTDGFEPSGESMSPSREGVSRVLSADVESRPHEYAASVEQFTTTAMHPTYVRGLVYGWYSAAKNDTPIEWAPALDLCDWVVDQGQEPELAQDARDEDAGWQRTRRWMASLLQQAVHARAPVELHERVWALLLALAEDDDPPRAAEPRPFDQHSDPYTQAINATRPLAIEGCIFYALWIRRRTADTETTGAPGFDRLGLSHVGAFLTQAIDDPSVAVRAVYGRLFPFIAAELSESWADRNRDAIFPTQGGESDRHFDAAFGTYLHFSGPRVPMLERLQDEYAYALRRVCTVDKGDRDLDADEAPLPDDDPATRDDGGTGGTPASTAGAGYGNDLAEHLLLFNIWGALDRGDRHQLMDAYLARAPEDVRDHGLAYIGRLIRRDGGPDLPADVNRRLQALVQHELDRTLELGQEMSARSAPLIQWLTSGVFDAIWALKRLAKLLARYDAFGAPMVYSEQSGIVTFLGGAPEENLQHVGWCVLAYVEAKRDGYLQRDWEDTLTSLLRRMYASDSPAIRKRGEQAIHRLGELGQFGFGELLLRQPDASAE